MQEAELRRSPRWWPGPRSGLVWTLVFNTQGKARISVIPPEPVVEAELPVRTVSAAALGAVRGLRRGEPSERGQTDASYRRCRSGFDRFRAVLTTMVYIRRSQSFAQRSIE